MTPGFGVIYPDGTYTGVVSVDRSLAVAYARIWKGSVYQVGSAEDPERKRKMTPNPNQQFEVPA
jgi:hypothetical protein